MSKRKFDANDPFDTVSVARKYQKRATTGKKHTLDSDEEDFQDEDNVMDENEFEGEEDGVATQEGEQRMTAFNMNEEMELGHFDRQGHFIWNNEKEVRDNWLDNIDWHQIKRNANLDGADERGLGSDSDDGDRFDETATYRLVLTYVRPGETVSRALRRLGADTEKLSSIERLRRKRAGTLSAAQAVTELTELANKVLVATGNMDVYQETYEQIAAKVAAHDRRNKAKRAEPELDMYADNFDDRERERLDASKAEGAVETKEAAELMWEFKWDQNKEAVEGPFDTQRMLRWSNEGYFKTGVWVRKCGEDTGFYTSNRIDFELYL